MPRGDGDRIVRGHCMNKVMAAVSEAGAMVGER